MDQSSIIQKGSRSPPEHAEMQREHDMKVLASIQEEDLSCVSSTLLQVFGILTVEHLLI